MEQYTKEKKVPKTKYNAVRTIYVVHHRCDTSCTSRMHTAYRPSTSTAWSRSITEVILLLMLFLLSLLFCRPTAVSHRRKNRLWSQDSRQDNSKVRNSISGRNNYTEQGAWYDAARCTYTCMYIITVTTSCALQRRESEINPEELLLYSRKKGGKEKRKLRKLRKRKRIKIHMYVCISHRYDLARVCHMGAAKSPRG